MTGKLSVLYFAAARERAGAAAETVDLPTPATAGALLEALSARHPALAPLLPHLRVAVNRELAPLDAPLADGDEVALIPPVAGGSGGGSCRVVDRPLALDEVVAAVRGNGQGAVVTFTGTVRDVTGGR